MPERPSSDSTTLAQIVDAVSYLRSENARLVRALAAGHGIGPNDMRALHFIATLPGATAGQVAERLNITTGATTALLDRLDQRGLIERRPNAVDRRSITLYASELGQRMIAHNLEVYVDALLPALEGSDLGELRDSIDAMARAFRLASRDDRIAVSDEPVET